MKFGWFVLVLLLVLKYMKRNLVRKDIDVKRESLII